jgi:endonuclease VIII
MPEGDTLYRTAAGLRPHLVGRKIVAASARQPGPRAEVLVGSTVQSVESRGKQLLIAFDSGLELRTHLGMHGSWHRYAPGQAWQRPRARARLVLEVDGAVAVCFDAPTVELFDARAAATHPVLAALGPDLLAEPFGDAQVREAVVRLGAPGRARLTIAEALLDQTALAGIGNVYKSEVLFLERVNPFASAAEVAAGGTTLERMVLTARRLLLASRDGGPRDTTGRSAELRLHASELWVYGRAGRPCHRCGSIVLDRTHGRLNRRTFWCPRCQPAAPESAGHGSAGDAMLSDVAPVPPSKQPVSRD